MIPHESTSELECPGMIRKTKCPFPSKIDSISTDANQKMKKITEINDNVEN